MARSINRLSARMVATTSKPGKYNDGGGLYLQVSPSGSKSWLFRFMLRGAERWMGLGSVNTVPLAEARIAAEGCRKQLREGIAPIDAQNVERGQRRADAARVMTFEQCAEAYITAHEPGWRNAKHADQWRNTLKAYAYPVIGGLPVGTIDTGLTRAELKDGDAELVFALKACGKSIREIAVETGLDRNKVHRLLKALRSLQALCRVFLGPNHPVVAALALAEYEDNPEAVAAAWDEFERVPSVPMRKILGHLAASLPPPPKPRR